jgi:hypothetical protein
MNRETVNFFTELLLLASNLLDLIVLFFGVDSWIALNMT